MVGPTKLQPRFFNSFEISAEVAVFGIAMTAARSTSFGRSCDCGSNFQNQAASEPASSTSSRARLALLMVETILPRWRMMPAFASSRSTSFSREIGDALEIEAVERLAEILALPEDGQPGQSRLETFEADLLEQPDVVADRPAPFVVVIVAVELVIAGPGAAQRAVFPAISPVLLVLHSINSRLRAMLYAAFTRFLNAAVTTPKGLLTNRHFSDLAFTIRLPAAANIRSEAGRNSNYARLV